MSAIVLSPLATALLKACTSTPSWQADIVARATLVAGYSSAEFTAAFDELCCASLVRTNESRGDGRFALIDAAADMARFEAYLAARRAADNVRSAAEREAHAQWERDCASALKTYEAGFVFAPEVSTVISTKRPRKANVARWVAILASPPYVGHGVEDRKWDTRDRANAKGQLASWGLQADGTPCASVEPVGG